MRNLVKYIVFSDAHVEPGDNLYRFDWLGSVIVHTQPQVIVQLGDFASMLSLSHWDQNKKLIMEGRRFYDDVSIAKTAVRRMFAPLQKLQDKQRQQKHKVYKPSIIWCDGNHEEWITRYNEHNPEMHQYVKPFYTYIRKTLENVSMDVVHVPYKGYHIRDGIAFTHCPIMANGNPIGGKYVNEKALDLFHTHIVFGHTHRFLHSHRYLHGHGLKQAINTGCFFQHTPQYAKGAANEHFRTLIGIDIRNDGLLEVHNFNWEGVV